MRRFYHVVTVATPVVVEFNSHRKSLLEVKAAYTKGCQHLIRDLLTQTYSRYAVVWLPIDLYIDGVTGDSM